jgi:hypothetical protein
VSTQPTRNSGRAGRIGRSMWLATRENGRMLSFSTTKANNDYLDPHPVLVLDISSPEALVERVARALAAWERNRYGRCVDRRVLSLSARAVLRSLGLPSAGKGKAL